MALERGLPNGGGGIPLQPGLPKITGAKGAAPQVAPGVARRGRSSVTVAALCDALWVLSAQHGSLAPKVNLSHCFLRNLLHFRPTKGSIVNRRVPMRGRFSKLNQSVGR